MVPFGGARDSVQMEHAGALAALNRRILEEYSRRTSQALSAALPFRLALPHLEQILASNVGKEVEKDALVIRRAGAAVEVGALPSREDLHELLEASKAIDRAFLAGVGRLPIGIVISYDEIAPLRLQRIERLCHAAFRVLEAWQPGHGVRTAIRASYGRADLERLLLDLLRLYALETQVLSRAVRLPALLTPLRDRIGQGLARIMNETARRLAYNLAGMVYRR